MRKITSWYYCILGVFAGMFLLAPYFWFFDVLVSFVVQFLVVAAACLLLLLLQRRFTPMILLIAVMAYFAWPLFPLLSVASSGGNIRNEDDVHARFSILNININFKNSHYESLMKIIQHEKPTFIVLNEATEVYMFRLSEALGNMYPYQINLATGSDSYLGIAVLSQLPFDSHRIRRFNAETPPLIEARVDSLGLTLFAIHALPPTSELLEHFRDGFLRYVGELAAATEGQLLVIGDFNSTIHSSAFKKMMHTANLQDSRSGHGWKPSWLVDTPLALSIDHVLFKGGRIHVTDFRMLSDVSSDHRPMLVTALITKSPV